MYSIFIFYILHANTTIPGIEIHYIVHDERGPPNNVLVASNV